MITNIEAWNKWQSSNTDPYGKACIDVAREAMRLLDANEKFDPHGLITQADRNVCAGGITGFMAGIVAKIITTCHSRGAEFNEAWNTFWGVSPEKAKGGTVNPAIINIG